MVNAPLCLLLASCAAAPLAESFDRACSYTLDAGATPSSPLTSSMIADGVKHARNSTFFAARVARMFDALARGDGVARVRVHGASFTSGSGCGPAPPRDGDARACAAGA